MIQGYSKKIVTAGFFLALGVILPFVTAHGFGMSGNILLPMHIPVLLCGFFCGPMYGTLCGAVLPITNSMITGMPVMYPMALLMTLELTAYGLVSGSIYKATGYSKKLAVIYGALLAAMVAGRVVYGIAAWLLLFVDADAGKFSVIASVVTGMPGIIIQLIVVPGIVILLQNNLKRKHNAAEQAIELIENEAATCVVVRGNEIIIAESPRGIAYVIGLYEKGELKDAFVADKIIGKAAAMLFTLGGVRSCYGENVSETAVEWLKSHNVAIKYKNISQYIVNRAGDGMCPMEATVADINDERRALRALKDKIAELKGISD